PARPPPFCSSPTRRSPDLESLARRSLSEVRATVTDLQHPDLAEQLDQAANALTAAELSFHRPEALPRLTLVAQLSCGERVRGLVDRKSTRLNSSHVSISYA